MVPVWAQWGCSKVFCSTCHGAVGKCSTGIVGSHLEWGGVEGFDFGCVGEVADVSVMEALPQCGPHSSVRMSFTEPGHPRAS